MGVTDRGVALDRRQRTRGTHQCQFAAQSVGTERDAEPCCSLKDRIVHRDLRKLAARGDDPAAQLRLRLPPLADECANVALIRVTALHHLDARGKIVGRAHLDRESESVEQLRPQLAFLRIAAAEGTCAIERRRQFRRHRARADGAVDEELVDVARGCDVGGQRAFHIGAEFRQFLLA